MYSGKVHKNLAKFRNLFDFYLVYHKSSVAFSEYIPYARHYKRRLVYSFYPIFKDHLCTVKFGLMYGLYSRAAYDGERMVVKL